MERGKSMVWMEDAGMMGAEGHGGWKRSSRRQVMRLKNYKTTKAAAVVVVVVVVAMAMAMAVCPAAKAQPHGDIGTSPPSPSPQSLPGVNAVVPPSPSPSPSSNVSEKPPLSPPPPEKPPLPPSPPSPTSPSPDPTPTLPSPPLSHRYQAARYLGIAFLVLAAFLQIFFVIRVRKLRSSHLPFHHVNPKAASKM